MYGLLRNGVARGILAATLVLGVGTVGVSNALAQEEVALVRVVHASPDAPAVDIWVDGEVAVEELAFGEATDLIPLPAGSYDVAVTPAGGAAEDAVIEATLDLEAGAGYEVAAVGTLDEIAAQVYPIDLSPIGEGQARVRVIHASPDAPAVDVAVAGGPILFEGIEFPNAGDYADVDAGSYDLEVLASGTDTVALDLPGVAFDAGVVYDVFAIGLLDDGSLTVLTLTADASTAVGGGDDDDDAGGTTTVPSTGIGSTATGVGLLGWLLVGSTLLLIVSGGYLALQPARRRR